MKALENISLSTLMKFLEVEPLTGDALVEAQKSLSVSDSAVVYALEIDDTDSFIADEANYHASSFTLQISGDLTLDVDWDHDDSRKPHFELTFHGNDTAAYDQVMAELKPLL